MEMTTRDTILKKILDAQENVRDYEMFSKQVADEEVARMYKKFAEESGMQATKLQEIFKKYDKKS